MTGPTTAAHLVELLSRELNELLRRAGTPAAASAHELAAAWPRFQQAGERLMQALLTEPDSGDRRAVVAAQTTTGRLDPGLQRAADYLGAAADLMGTRDRRSLTTVQRDADAHFVGQRLAATAHLVVTVTAGDPELLGTVAAAAGAATSWQARSGGTDPSLRSLADASTAGTPTTPGQGADVLAGAIYSWQRAAIAAAHLPATNRRDLFAAASAAGLLIGLSQALLQAHADTAGPRQLVAATNADLRRAGLAWNTAAHLWQRTATGGVAADPQLGQAMMALQRAVQVAARDGADWASPAVLRARTPANDALTLGLAALAAAQGVAEHHAALLARLGETGSLYMQAKHLPVPANSRQAEQQAAGRLAGRWVPLTVAQSAAHVTAYQQLPGATATARLAYSSLTDPVMRQSRTDQPAGRSTHGQTYEPIIIAETVPVTLAGQRWQKALLALDPRLTVDPHYPVLAGALDRIELAGVDVTASLAAAAAARPLPDEHTARALHYQLIDVCPAAITPYTDTPNLARPPVHPAMPADSAAVHRAPPAPTTRR